MTSIQLAYLHLATAIICEVLGTSFLVKSEQFTRLTPTVLMALLYAVSFYMLAQTVKTIPLGIAYAIWGGLGIFLTTMVGMVVFKQRLDPAALVGIVMIVGGVVVMNLFSKSIGH